MNIEHLIEKHDLNEEEKRAVRIAIAEDVLKYLDTTKVEKDGSYVDKYEWLEVLDKGVLRGVLGDNARNHLHALRRCQVCAIGACFLSYINLFNKVTVGNIDGYTAKENLGKFFSPKELREIESIFEEFEEWSIHKEEQLRWILTFPEPKERLRAMMENVVRNGKFVVDDIKGVTNEA